MGLLDLYNNSQTLDQLNILDPDLVTQYPATNTGTPTPTANPGGPNINFNQVYNANNTYLNNISSLETEGLNNTLRITNLDVENPGVNGGVPYKQVTDPTIYPITTTHTEDIKGFFPEPSEPAKKFNQTFNPNNTYLNFIKPYT